MQQADLPQGYATGRFTARVMQLADLPQGSALLDGNGGMRAAAA